MDKKQGRQDSNPYTKKGIQRERKGSGSEDSQKSPVASGWVQGA